MDPWLALGVALDLLAVLLVVRLTVLVNNHQRVTVNLSQRFAPSVVIVGEDK